MGTKVFDTAGRKVRLDEISADPPKGMTREKAEKRFATLGQQLFDLQDAMFGAKVTSVLVVLQGRDGAGNDGAIKHVVGCLNPRGVILQPDLVEHVAQVLEETALPPEHLKLEITENVLFENPETASTLLMRLRGLGVQLYIDDFGTGYSSLSYLHRLPINGLKIDRSFVKRIDDVGENQPIIRTIMTLARDLNIDAVAEGVETASQLAHLESLNCAYWQGFLFSKPVRSEEAQALIAA